MTKNIMNRITDNGNMIKSCDSHAEGHAKVKRLTRRLASETYDSSSGITHPIIRVNAKSAFCVNHISYMISRVIYMYLVIHD